ncbi:MAG: DUF4166 domain-containing protein [Acidimicrobiales bacterium]
MNAPARVVGAGGSIFQQALGEDFHRLHPKLQWRCALAPGDGVFQIGRGTMEEIRRAWWAKPVLAAIAARRILCPEQGREVAFTIEGHAYVDRFGRSTLAASRRFRFPGRFRRSDSTTVYDERQRCLVDYLGTNQNLSTQLRATVDEQGALCLSSAGSRLHLGPVSFVVPSSLAGTARVREWWDVSRQRFGIDVQVQTPIGELLAYRGFFDLAEHPYQQTGTPPDARSL